MGINDLIKVINIDESKIVQLGSIAFALFYCFNREMNEHFIGLFKKKKNTFHHLPSITYL